MFYLLWIVSDVSWCFSYLKRVKHSATEFLTFDKKQPVAHRLWTIRWRFNVKKAAKPAESSNWANSWKYFLVSFCSRRATRRRGVVMELRSQSHRKRAASSAVAYSEERPLTPGCQQAGHNWTVLAPSTSSPSPPPLSLSWAHSPSSHKPSYSQQAEGFPSSLPLLKASGGASLPA